MKQTFYSLDAFRGLAAIFVVLYHSPFYISSTNISNFILHSGNFVEFFFILSGFVMAHSYLNKINKTITFKDYILKRFIRLYPLHLFLLLIWGIFILLKWIVYQYGIGFTNPFLDNGFFALIEHLFLVQSLGFSNSSLTWNYPAWSISAEFYTYILFFSVVYFLFRTKLFTAIIILIALGFLLYSYGLNTPKTTLGIFKCIGTFFLGVVLYKLYKLDIIKIKNVYLATFMESLLIFFIYFSISIGDKYILYQIFSFSLTIYFFSIQNNGLISKLLKINLFQYLGKLSYSIYMVHALIIVIVSNIIEYIVKIKPLTSAILAKGFVGEWTILVNIFIVFVVIFLSHFTYKYIEYYFIQKYLTRKVK